MTIKAGDSVWIAEPTYCCGSTKALGRVFVVAEVRLADAIYCPSCRGYAPKALCATRGGNKVIELSRLRKIPPLSELERKTEEAMA